MDEMMYKYKLSIDDYNELIECGYSNISGKSIVYPKSDELYKGWVEEKFVTELKEAIRKYNISKLW